MTLALQIIFLFPVDNDGNGEIGRTNEELDSYYVNDIDDPARGEMTTEMNSNIAYQVSKRINTKKNVAYAAVGGPQ